MHIKSITPLGDKFIVVTEERVVNSDGDKMWFGEIMGDEMLLTPCKVEVKRRPDSVTGERWQ